MYRKLPRTKQLTFKIYEVIFEWRKKEKIIKVAKRSEINSYNEMSQGRLMCDKYLKGCLTKGTLFYIFEYCIKESENRLKSTQRVHQSGRNFHFALLSFKCKDYTWLYDLKIFYYLIFSNVVDCAIESTFCTVEIIETQSITSSTGISSQGPAVQNRWITVVNILHFLHYCTSDPLRASSFHC